MAADHTAPPEVQPPRPPNSWILYRADKSKQLPPVAPGAPLRTQGDVSTLLSGMWREETVAIKAHYERLADIKKAEHNARYPNYQYLPKKKPNKGQTKPKKPKRATPYPTSARLQHALASTSVHYNHVEQHAPSPPLSAAPSTPSSPNFRALYLDPEPSIRAESSSAAATHAPSFGGYVPSPLGPVPMPDLSQAHIWSSSAQSSHVSWPSYGLHENEPRLTLESCPSQETPSHITLEIPDLQEQPGWDAQGGSLDYMQAMLSATGDSSNFQASFDPSILTSEPPVDLDLSYAQIEDPSYSDAYLSTFEQQYHVYNQQEHQQHNAPEEIGSQQYAAILSYPNLTH